MKTFPDTDPKPIQADVSIGDNAATFAYASQPESRLRDYLCDMEQLAYARLSVLSEGDGRGNRIIEVNNGSGLAFTVTPDRGMDIVEASFRGIPIAWRAPAGHVSPGRGGGNGFDWLRVWPGGLLTTCGLRHVGPPEQEPDNPLDTSRGLHGRISASSAESLGISKEWKAARYEINLSGTLREAMMFGENLRLKRRISTALGDNSIYIEDRVSNIGVSPEYIQILYHCNFGYPFIMPGTQLLAGDSRPVPRNDYAAEGLSQWHLMPEAQTEVREMCFLHHIPPQLDGWAEIAAINRTAGLKVTVSYDTLTLPRLMQWKLYERGRYVIGLEPTNSTVSGRNKDIAAGAASSLPPGESMVFRVRLGFDNI